MASDPLAKPVQNTVRDEYRAQAEFLPKYLQILEGAIPQLAQAQLAGAQATTPGYNQLALDTYRGLAPEFAKTGTSVEDITRRGSLATDVGLLKGPGQELIDLTNALQRKTDPEYYKTREKVADRTANLLDAININDLSGSERAQIERAINRGEVSTGSAGTGAAVNAAANAMQFGDALAKKRAELSSAIQTATGTLPAIRTGFDATQQVLNRPGTNAGTTQFQGVQKVDNSAQGLMQNMMDNISRTSINNANINSQRRDSLDRVNETLSSLPNISG